MTAWVIALLAGGATGILSAFGIGGGSLLLIPLGILALGGVGYGGYKGYKHYQNKKRGYE